MSCICVILITQTRCKAFYFFSKLSTLFTKLSCRNVHKSEYNPTTSINFIPSEKNRYFKFALHGFYCMYHLHWQKSSPNFAHGMYLLFSYGSCNSQNKQVLFLWTPLPDLSLWLILSVFAVGLKPKFMYYLLKLGSLKVQVMTLLCRRDNEVMFWRLTTNIGVVPHR